MQFLAEPTPHKQAVDFIKSLPTVDRDTFDRLPDEFKASAFLVTGIKAHDVLQDLRDTLASIPQGEDFETTRARIEKKLLPHLGGNEKAAKARALILSRAWTGRAYNMGQAVQVDNHTAAFPFRKRMSVEDQRVRASHAALSGVILPADSPFWLSHTPPDAHNCRCFIVGVTRSAMERAKRADAAAIAAGTLEPDKVRVLEGPLLKKLEDEGTLIRGMTEIYHLRDEPGRVNWNPKTLLIPMDEIAARYDAQTWGEFEKWSRGKMVGKRSLWDMLEAQRTAAAAKPGPNPRPAPAPTPAPAPKPAPAPAPTPAPQPAPAPAPAPQPAPKPAPAPVAAPATVQPASTAPAHQVAAHMQIKPKRGAVKDAGRSAVDAIAKVHSNGGMLESPLLSKRMAKAYGMYSRKMVGEWPARKLETSISIHPKGDHPVMTTLHEIGHKIDFEAVQTHSESMLVRTELIEALKATPRAKQITEHATLAPRWKTYAMSDVELFARAYAQYIALRSGAATAQAELAKELEHPLRGLTQWPEAEFEPIAKIFDRLFKARGWAK